jgi:hypothetical protein
MTQLPAGSHRTLPFCVLEITRANSGLHSARTEERRDVDSQRLLTAPPEKVLGAEVPERDDAEGIQRDESVVGKPLDGETKNDRERVSAIPEALFSHETFRIGWRGE